MRWFCDLRSAARPDQFRVRMTRARIIPTQPVQSQTAYNSADSHFAAVLRALHGCEIRTISILFLELCANAQSKEVLSAANTRFDIDTTSAKIAEPAEYQRFRDGCLPCLIIWNFNC